MTLSDTIRRALARDGRSLFQLAIDSKLDRGQLVRFRNADRELTLPAADRLCKALRLELRTVERVTGQDVKTSTPARARPKRKA